jgi:hypothetical protein
MPPKFLLAVGASVLASFGAAGGTSGAAIASSSSDAGLWQQHAVARLRLGVAHLASPRT